MMMMMVIILFQQFGVTKQVRVWVIRGWSAAPSWEHEKRPEEYYYYNYYALLRFDTGECHAISTASAVQELLQKKALGYIQRTKFNHKAK